MAESEATLAGAKMGSGTKLKALKKMIIWVMVIVFIMLLLPWLWRQAVKFYYGSQFKTVETAEPARVAVVFGAAVYRDGRLSSVLRDRMDTAVALYHEGKVEKLLLSGDNRFNQYNEPGAMMAYAISHGIDEADIQPDYAGLRTYDTCYRARHIFEVDEAILVTQAFHLPRAIFTCRQLGVDARGVQADLRPYRASRWYEFRETIATSRALWDVLRREPAQILGDTIPLQ